MFIHKFARLGVVAALTVGGNALAAEGVSHTFVEAGYGYTELAGGAADGDGFAVAGSFELPSNFIVSASYQDFQYEEDVGLDLSDLSAGVGYRFALSGAFDLVTGVSFERLESEGEDESGFGLNLGARTRVTDQLELSAGIKYQDIKDLPSTFGVSVGGRYYFTPAFAAGLDVRKSDFVFLASETRFIATLRYDFGASR